MTCTEPHPLNERLLKPGEVAELFRVSARTVTSWTRSGRLDSTKTPGGGVRVRESVVIAMLAAQHENGPAGAPPPDRPLIPPLP